MDTDDLINTLAADSTGARHQVAVITIGERPTINTDYTPDLQQATKGVQRIFATPGTGAYLRSLQKIANARDAELTSALEEAIEPFTCRTPPLTSIVAPIFSSLATRSSKLRFSGDLYVARLALK